jgi:hypothetical protein
MSEDSETSRETKKFLDDIVELARLTTVLADRQIHHAEAIVSLIKRMNEIEARQWTKEHSS